MRVFYGHPVHCSVKQQVITVEHFSEKEESLNDSWIESMTDSVIEKHFSRDQIPNRLMAHLKCSVYI